MSTDTDTAPNPPFLTDDMLPYGFKEGRLEVCVYETQDPARGERLYLYTETVKNHLRAKGLPRVAELFRVYRAEDGSVARLGSAVWIDDFVRDILYSFLEEEELPILPGRSAPTPEDDAKWINYSISKFCTRDDPCLLQTEVQPFLLSRDVIRRLPTQDAVFRMYYPERYEE